MINSKELYSFTKNLTVLFAEDHEELRINTTEILKNFFKDVHSVENGQKAIELYEENPNRYDIILSDIQMPKLNGVELTEKIYALNPSQLIIIISAYDEAKYLLPLINLGIEQFIKKPINYNELMKVLLDTSKKIIEPKSEESSESKIKIQLDDTVVFNRENSSLYNKNKNIYLTKYEIIFLQLLSTNVEKIYTNDDIVANFSSLDEGIDPQNIRKLVSKLRKKIPENSLESIYGVGYKLTSYTNV